MRYNEINDSTPSLTLAQLGEFFTVPGVCGRDRDDGRENEGMRETAGLPRRHKLGWFAILGILAAILLLFFFFWKDLMIPFVRMEIAGDVTGASELMRSRGIHGAAAVALVEALQMVVVFVPAEFIQISTALSYPFPLALLLCDLGVCLGATIIFLLVRVFHVENAAYEKRRGTIDRVSASARDRNTAILLYFLFFMPVIPFGAICYYGAGTRMKYWKYLLTTATGVVPSIAVSNLMGTAGEAFLHRSLPLWLLVLLVIAAAALLIVLGGLLIQRFCVHGTRSPDSLTYAFLFLAARLWRGGRQKLELDDARLCEVEGPYVMLSNHESFFDFYYISKLAHPRNPSYLVNEYYCTRPVLKGLSRGAGILSKKLFTGDMAAAVGILRTLKSGFPVVIFPEGRLSADGRTNPVVEQGGAFYKRLGVDLVLVRIDGAYYAKPKWRKRSYRSRIRVSVERVLKREEIAGMSPVELDRVIGETIRNDASASTLNRYPCRRSLAAGLENVLYRCPDCGALYTTRTRHRDFFCTACGARRRLNAEYRFTDGTTIPELYDRIAEMEDETLPSCNLRAEVRTKIFGAKGGPVRKEEGVCTLTAEGFRYVSANEDFTVPWERLPALAYSCGEEFELYHGEELCYFYPKETPQQAARWAVVVDRMHALREAERQKEGEQAEHR